MRTLTELEAKAFLKKYGIPITKQKLAKNRQEALKLAKQIKFPVVMKIVSPDIVHKTEAKGVAVKVCESEVQNTFDKLVKNAKKHKKNASIKGVSIQEMAKGTEAIIGTSTDPQFGPTIMFGLGGIYVEILKDVSFRVIPIKRDDAWEMVKETKAYEVLAGARGKKPAKLRTLVKVLLKVSKMVNKNPRIKELDINPLFVSPKGVKAADARIVMEA